MAANCHSSGLATQPGGGVVGKGCITCSSSAVHPSTGVHAAPQTRHRRRAAPRNPTPHCGHPPPKNLLPSQQETDYKYAIKRHGASRAALPPHQGVRLYTDSSDSAPAGQARSPLLLAPGRSSPTRPRARRAPSGAETGTGTGTGAPRGAATAQQPLEETRPRVTRATGPAAPGGAGPAAAAAAATSAPAPGTRRRKFIYRLAGYVLTSRSAPAPVRQRKAYVMGTWHTHGAGYL